MKIKVKAMVIKEIEVDDKFNVLALGDPNYLSYPESTSLYEELDSKIEEATEFSTDWSNNDFSTPKVTEISRLSDNSLMYEA
jgi:hypothetical protein